MATRVRTSKQTLALLAALAGKPSDWHYGYALSRETELMSGTLYPILMRLEERGWLETQWETPETSAEKRGGHPPRHMYRLTASGRAAAIEALMAAKGKTKPRGALRPGAGECPPSSGRTYVGAGVTDEPASDKCGHTVTTAIKFIPARHRNSLRAHSAELWRCGRRIRAGGRWRCKRNCAK